MNNFRMGRVVALGLSFLSGMFAQVGIAQQSHSDSAQLEEIVVTAEKRESDRRDDADQPDGGLGRRTSRTAD